MCGFLCLKNQPYNNVSFKYWPFINWYKAISTINPFKQPKRALELKLVNFKIFKTTSILSACLPFFREYTYNCKLRILALFKCFKLKEPRKFSVKNFIGWNPRKISPANASSFTVCLLQVHIYNKVYRQIYLQVYMVNWSIFHFIFNYKTTVYSQL